MAAATALGHSLFQLGQFQFEQRQIKDAVGPVQESVDMFTKLLAQHPGDALYKAGLGRGLTRGLAQTGTRSGEDVGPGPRPVAGGSY